MLKRKAIASIKNWVNTKNKKCLVVQGARQTGKTYIIERFAEDNYEELLEINFKQMASAVDIFSGDLTVDNMVMAMRFRFPEKKILPGKTLIFLDEIQECQEAITSLKFWAIDNRYDVIVSGSLLGIDYKRASSYPVGYVDYLRMYGMDFEEFLWGMGISEDMIGNLCGYLESKTVIPEAIHSQMMNYYRQYIAIGGMPEVVLKYVETDSLLEVRRIQSEILQGYDLDFSKHAPKEQVPRVRMVWNSIPSQLFKENKKFIYGALRKGARANDFEMAIQWLVNAGLLYKVPRCTKPELPLDIYEDLSAFKLYMVDLGLMGAMVKTDPAQVLIKNDIFKEYKGGMTEQYVLQQMKSKGVSPIYYHNTDNSRLELDFVIQRNAQMVPIEVKAEGNVRANSLTALLGKRPELHAERFSMLPYKVQGNLTNFPLYAI